MAEKLLTDAELAANGSAWAAGERLTCRLEAETRRVLGIHVDDCQDCECSNVCAAERGEKGPLFMPRGAGRMG